MIYFAEGKIGTRFSCQKTCRVDSTIEKVASDSLTSLSKNDGQLGLKRVTVIFDVRKKKSIDAAKYRT